MAVEKKETKKEKTVEKPSPKKKEPVKKAATTSKKKSETKKTVKSEKPKSKLDILKEKAKELEAKVKEADKIDIKGEVKGEKEAKKDALVPIEDYLKASVHLGTRVVTPHMRGYVYRRRADGLAVFNTSLLDDKIKEGADFLSGFAPDEIVIVCKREAGWKAVAKFAETLGIKYFTKKYPAGTLTNTILEDFFERNLLMICDPWLDKNALRDANKIKMSVFGICDTNNYTFGIDKFVPGNNKNARSLGIILYLLAKLYVQKRKLDISVPAIQEFIEGWDELEVTGK